MTTSHAFVLVVGVIGFAYFLFLFVWALKDRKARRIASQENALQEALRRGGVSTALAHPHIRRLINSYNMYGPFCMFNYSEPTHSYPEHMALHTIQDLIHNAALVRFLPVTMVVNKPNQVAVVHFFKKP